MSQSAFIVRVPEAEPFVDRWRERFDSVQRLGVPAHITILFPFVAAELITAPMLASVAELARGIEPFRFELRRTGRFPGTLYLVHEPGEVFVEMTRRVFQLFPDHPPYGGQFADIVPHLTVAHGSDSDSDEAERDIVARLKQAGQIRAQCVELVLIEDSSGRWQSMRVFPLGAG